MFGSLESPRSSAEAAYHAKRSETISNLLVVADRQGFYFKYPTLAFAVVPHPARQHRWIEFLRKRSTPIINRLKAIHVRLFQFQVY